MYPEETKRAARHARANAEEVKTHNARVELSQAAHQLALGRRKSANDSSASR
jgi:hypothetical protein